MQACSDDVQLGLGERALHAQHEAVVELARVVAAVLVDDQRVGDGAQLQQAMPVLVGAREARCLQREDRADVAHRHIADQRLEVLPARGSGARLAEVAVEDTYLLRAPAERLRLGCQIVLALGALLVEADLGRRRLANVDAGHPRQVLLGNLDRHHRLPPSHRAAGRRLQDRTRPCWR